MPLLSSQQCHFHLQTAPWALTWTPSLILRFTNTTQTTRQLTHTGTDSEPLQPEQLSHTHTDSEPLQSEQITHPCTGPQPLQPHMSDLEDRLNGRSHQLSTTAQTDSGVTTKDQQTFPQLTLAQEMSESASSGNSQGIALRLLKEQKQPALMQNAGSSEDQQSPVGLIGAQAAAADHGASFMKTQPHCIVPLFDGGNFDASYNDKYKPVEFVMPESTQKAVLEAVITGEVWYHTMLSTACMHQAAQ